MNRDHLLTMHVSDDHKQMWIDCKCGWCSAKMPVDPDDHQTVEVFLTKLGHEHIAEVTTA